MNLDTIFIFILLGIGYFFTLLLIIAYEYKHIKHLKANTFFMAKCTQAIAWFFLIFRGGHFDYLGIVFANSILFISYTYEIIALRELTQPLNEKTKMRYLIFTIVSIIGFHIIFIFYNQESIRIAYYAFVNAVIYLSVYQVIIGKGHTILMRMVGSMYVLFAAMSLFRGALSLISDTSGSLFNPGNYQLFFLLCIFVFSNFGSIGFILLQKEKVDQSLIHFATYDDLTNTLNRRTFSNRSKKYLDLYTKKKQCISYILFDIDHFKRINDTVGHHMGDQVLQELTRNIQQQLDKDDLFGRYGGDEFGIFMPGKDIAASNKTAERIQQALNDPRNHQLPVTYSVSIGMITVVPTCDIRLDTLYKYCDTALYKAKSNGRNAIVRCPFNDNVEGTQFSS